MLNVSTKYLIAIFVCAALLTSCKDPDLDVSSLGKKLPAPSLKGTSPFNQDFDIQGYARVQGNCDTRVGNVFISFDKQIWHQPPVNPDITGTSLAAGTTNDRDCSSDGSFDIYLTKNDLQNIWGIQTGSNGNHVDYIYIKGESLIGDTETLTLVDNNSGTSPGSNNTPAKIILEKTWPRGFAGASTCDSFRVSVLSAGGYRVPTSTAITFSVESRLAGTTGKIQAYTNWQDCSNGIAATQDTFTIPANADGTDVIYKFPEAPLNQILEFRVAQPSALTPDANFTSVILRDSSPASPYRWLSAEEYIHQIYKGLCYPIKIRSYNYNHSYASDQYPGSVTLTSSDSQVKFYDSSSCTTESSTYAFPNYTYETVAYVKYNPAASESLSFKDFTITMVAADGGGSPSLIYDSSPTQMRVDLTTKSTVSSIDIWGPRELVSSTCYSFRVVSMNENGTLLPVNTPTTIALGTVEADVGTFHYDQACTGTSMPSISIAAQSSSMQVYFKPLATASGLFHFNLISTGLSAKAREMYIRP